jgi:hypothetical protein
MSDVCRERDLYPRRIQDLPLRLTTPEDKSVMQLQGCGKGNEFPQPCHRFP